jgi:hypothetical protein
MEETTRIHTMQSTTIYPGTMRIMPVTAQDALKGGNLLILPEGEFEEIAVATINPVRNSGLAYTKVVNCTDHPITIGAGQKFGTGYIATIQKNIEEMGKGLPQMKMTKAQFLKRLTEDFKLEENKYMSEKEKRELLELLYKYKRVIAKFPSDIGTCKEVKCHIETVPGKTAKAQPRPLPPHLKSNPKKKLEDWLESGVYKPAPSYCSWSSPLGSMKKKNVETRWSPLPRTE